MSVTVDSHPPPLAKKGKIRALSMRASRTGDASAARQTGDTHDSAAMNRKIDPTCLISIPMRTLCNPTRFESSSTVTVVNPDAGIDHTASIPYCRSECDGAHTNWNVWLRIGRGQT